MKFSKYYDFYFENEGKCPECGNWLVPHIGCIGVKAGETEKNNCSYSKKRLVNFYNHHVRDYIKFFMNRYAYKGKYKKNLDIQRKKTYIKTDY